MNKDHILELQREILNESAQAPPLTQNDANVLSPQVTKQVIDPPCLSVGSSLKSNNDYILELRVHKGDKTGLAIAQNWKSKLKSEANIILVEKIEIPPVNLLQTGANNSVFGVKKRPLHLGLSISPYLNTQNGTGTIGGFVENNAGKRLLLTNNHVLIDYADSLSNNSFPIYQPGEADLSRRQGNEIASFNDAIFVTNKGLNYIDAATATLNEGIAIYRDENVVPASAKSALKNRRIKNVEDEDQIDMISFSDTRNVFKMGRTTGHTTGVFSGLKMDGVKITHPIRGNFMFYGIYEIKSSTDAHFSQPGDSGSLVCFDDGESILGLGLHFAGGKATEEHSGKDIYLSYFCPLNTILKQLELTWL